MYGAFLFYIISKSDMLIPWWKFVEQKKVGRSRFNNSKTAVAFSHEILYFAKSRFQRFRFLFDTDYRFFHWYNRFFIVSSNDNGANEAVEQQLTDTILMYTHEEGNVVSGYGLSAGNRELFRQAWTRCLGPRSEKLSVEKSSALKSLNVESSESFEISERFCRISTALISFLQRRIRRILVAGT